MTKIKLSREVKISIIFIFALLLFVWGINYLKGSDLLQKTRKLYADYENVNGLMTANPVLLNGFRIGLVTDMYFKEDDIGKIRVEFTINNDILIPKNSIARIIDSDLLGSKAVQIVLGNQGEAVNKDVLIGETQMGLMGNLSSQIEPIKAKAESILASIDSITLAMNIVLNKETQNNLIKSFNEIQQTISHLNSSLSVVDQVLAKDKNKLSDIIGNIESITTNLKNNNEKISNAVNNFSNISDTLAAANLAQTIQEVSNTFGELNQSLNKLNKGEGSAGQLLSNDSLYLNLQNASKNLELLLEDLKENPNRYVSFSLFGKKNK
ncbi:MAG: MlaD family protein [Bacteroidales bacterium]|jgi:phospholipid/cholesterol/gamma-HCH transport system substrate-binding protein|nr:MlaD family protein [Bacteroidales bacterium]